MVFCNYEWIGHHPLGSGGNVYFILRIEYAWDTSIWDGEEILDTSIYDGKDNGMSLHEYELIDTLKDLRPTPVFGTKELSLVITGITELCCDIWLLV